MAYHRCPREEKYIDNICSVTRMRRESKDPAAAGIGKLTVRTDAPVEREHGRVRLMRNCLCTRGTRSKRTTLP